MNDIVITAFSLKDDVSLNKFSKEDDFDTKAIVALRADQAEAILDDCKWARMEWQWHAVNGKALCL